MAEQFMALLAGPLEARSQMGTRTIPEDELRGPARAAVRAFLDAWGAD
ncbi:hypothetical protein [Nonomuraea sp. JJY05]